jgi:hypothetical protein
MVHSGWKIFDVCLLKLFVSYIQGGAGMIIFCPKLSVSKEQLKAGLSDEEIRKKEELYGRYAFTPFQRGRSISRCAACEKFVMYFREGVLCGFPTMQKPQYLRSVSAD